MALPDFIQRQALWCPYLHQDGIVGGNVLQLPQHVHALVKLRHLRQVGITELVSQPGKTTLQQRLAAHQCPHLSKTRFALTRHCGPDLQRKYMAFSVLLSASLASFYMHLDYQASWNESS